MEDCGIQILIATVGQAGDVEYMYANLKVSNRTRLS